MADEGKISIEVELKNKQQLLSDAKQVDKVLKSFGSQTGAKMDEAAKKNAESAIRALNKIPKEVKTKLLTEAKEAGIKNFDEKLKRLPKSKQVELLTKVQDGKAVDFKKLIHEIPKHTETTVKAKDEASAPLRNVREETHKTSSGFKHLKEIMAGSIAAGLIQNALGAITTGLKEAYTAGMDYNKEQDTMRTVWKSLTTEAPKDGQQLVDYINKLGQSTIYSTGTINEMAQSFYHVHSNVKETKDWTDAFVALGSTLHMSNDALAESGEQFAKIVAGGKASAEDMAVMINRFPMFGEALQQATGKSMKQLYAMSAAGKLSAEQFTQTLDFLGKKYASGTKEAMTSFMGMGMFIHSKFSVLMGKITSSAFEMSKSAMTDIQKLLSDDMMEKYASGISKAMSIALSAIIKLLDYVADNKDVLVDIIGNLFKIGGIIGSTIWHTAYEFITSLAKAFGLVDESGKSAKDPLETIDEILKNLVANREGIEMLTKTWLAFFVTNKILSWIKTVNDARKAITEMGIATKIFGDGSGGGISLPSFGKKAGTSAAKGAAEDVVESAATSKGFLSKITGFFRGGSGKAVSEGADLMEDVSKGSSTLGRVSKFSGAIKGVAGVGAVITALSGLTTLLGSTKKTIGKNAGGVLGGAGAAYGGGAAGAAIGTAILPGIGTAIGGGLGAAIGSAAGTSVGKKLGKQIQDGVQQAFHPKLDDGVTKSTNKLKGGMKGFVKSYQDGTNEINKDMILLGSQSGKSAETTKNNLNKALSGMSANVDKYYKGKESQSKKDLALLVKNGSITQEQADKALKKEKQKDSEGAKSMKNAYANMSKETAKYYKDRDELSKKDQKSENKAVDYIKSVRQREKDYLISIGKLRTKSERDAFDKKTAEKVAAEKQKFQEKKDKDLLALTKNYKKNMKTLESQADSDTYAAMKVNAGKQKDLLEDLSHSKQKLSQKAMTEAIATSAKERDAVVKAANDTYDKVKDAANKKYKDTVAAADKEYYENHTISKKQYDAIVGNAKKERDDTVSAAKDQKDKVVKHANEQHKQVVEQATKQAGEHVNEVNTETGKVKGLWDKFLDKVAGIWNGVIGAWDTVAKLWGGKPHAPWKRYAAGTGGTKEDQFAVVGEEGFELAHHPSTGIFPIGVNGMETTFLPQGTSILPHSQSKRFMEMAGSLPHHADGVFGTIQNIWDKMKKTVTGLAGTAEKFISNGVSGAWKWLENKTGLESIVKNGGEMASMKNQIGSGAVKDIKSEFLKKFTGLFKKAKEDQEASAEGAKGNYSPSMIKKAAAAMGVSPDANFIKLLQATIQSESGGKNVMQGIHDRNSGGNEARGILQYVPGTFMNYAAKGHTNIWSPYDQLLAFFNNSDWRNSIGWTTIWGTHKVDWLHSGPQGGRRLAWGGRFDKATPAVIGEDGTEYAINVTKPNADELLAAAIEERAKYDQDGFFAKTLADVHSAQAQQTQAAATIPSFTWGGSDTSTKSSGTTSNDDGTDTASAVGAVAGSLKVYSTLNIDGRAFAKATAKATSEALAKFLARQRKGKI
jgi:tape measure domain-containing protein